MGLPRFFCCKVKHTMCGCKVKHTMCGCKVKHTMCGCKVKHTVCELLEAYPSFVRIFFVSVFSVIPIVF